MKTFKTYEPPFAEVITIEAQGVLCASSVSGTGTSNMSMSNANNQAIVM